MIAFHFPPLRGSSGIQRTVRFARYLPEFGWEPQVLTVRPGVYEAVGDGNEIPPGLAVHRTPALDAARAFAIGTRYPSWLARPDRWASWKWSAIPVGIELIRRFKPDILWSTYPIATAHAIAHSLARLSHVPWVADFRDPMAQEGYPPDPATWKSFERIESRTIHRARRSIFTTSGAARTYRLRYPDCADRISVIENGYDEEAFANLERPSHMEARAGPFLLLHSGIVYPSERDPAALFAALRALREQGRLRPDKLVIRFRAAIHDELIRDLATRNGVLDVVDIAPLLPYREALAEMMSADGLLVLQASNCNEQIPAKIYEYLRAKRPILGLADPAGDTGEALRRMGVDHIAALEDAGGIGTALERFIADVRSGNAPIPEPAEVSRASRRERTADLARVFDGVIAIVPSDQG